MTVPFHDWKGYFSASPTPFDASGKFLPEALQNIINWFISQKTHGIVVNGTTGEWATQTDSERKHVVELAREVIPRNIPFLVGISHSLPQKSLELADHASKTGADGVLVTVPPTRKLSDEEIKNFYKFMARELEVPTLIYNVPGFLGHDIPTHVSKEILEFGGNIVGIKDNTPNFESRIMTLRELPKGSALFSDVLEPETFEIFAKESIGSGQIGSGMPLGRLLSEAFELTWAGKIQEAKIVVDKFDSFKKEIVALIGKNLPWHSQIKAMMDAVSIDAGYPRFPSISIKNDKVMYFKLLALVEKYGEK